MNFSSSGEWPPPTWPPCNPMAALRAEAARSTTNTNGAEMRRKTSKRRRHQQRQAVGFFDGQILRNNLADHHVDEADGEKRNGETQAVQPGSGGRRHHRIEDPKQDLVNGILARPSQAETGQRHADLRRAEQAAGIGQQAQSRARGDVALLRQFVQSRTANGEQRNLGGGEKAVQRDDGELEESAGETLRVRYNRAVLFSSPLLRAINLSIAVLLVALLGAVYWFAWRPLPETSGEIAAPVSARATIARDALGVPHIESATWEDAIFLQGYATAQDRMWQMDALRRLAAGELAEVVGKAALESDQEARRLRLAQIADDAERTMPDADRAVLAAYARGVNYYLETHRGRLPLEFTLLSYDPRPWRLRDSILAGLHMYRTLTTSWREEIEKLHMLQRGDRAMVDFLFPARTGFDPQPGSNAWAVSGERSATGKPILANDPHLDFGIPATWYMIHLRAPGLNVTGVTLPGVPAVIIGHNENIAWGITNLGFDVQDLYRENIDPQTGRYAFMGRVEQARLERDAIAVKGAKPIETLTWVTRHGPIFLNDENRQYALHWAAADPGSFQFPVSRDRPRARLEGVYRRHRAISGSWAKFRLRRYGREHRVSCHRPQSDSPPGMRRRRAGRWRIGRMRMGRHDSVRRAAQFFQSRAMARWSRRIRIRFRRITSIP